MNASEFESAFRGFSGNMPFPWQTALYERFVSDRTDNIPTSCNIPTGLGKTSVIALWLIALANHPEKLPRRLVYVVNRRTVVDQTTDEAEKLQKHLREKAELQSLRNVLGEDLAISTLRGQSADNRKWSADPSKSAIICGTVDMIGSRLLFNGYRIGWKSRPLHAGFLGQDVLLVHDEAHLEPAFQTLIESIQKEQKRCNEFGKFRVMELTATSRGKGDVFTLGPEDKQHETVRKRITAKKTIRLHPLKDARKLADQVADLALAHRDSGRPILVFVRTVDDVLKIRDKLDKEKLPVETLTGTLRGQERDNLVNKETFKRFLPGANSAGRTEYLVCTSAGEVGVNISAYHLVCDLSTFDSMAQRLGRVNRFGECDDTGIVIVHPTTFEAGNEYEQRRERTLEQLKRLEGDGSPEALNRLDPEARQAAFAPTPTILPTSEILFDAWALTTIREPLPGRPPVEPYLHGLPTEWQPPETYVAWREEVQKINGDLLGAYNPSDLLDDYPLKPHELLREPSYRAFKHFELIAKRRPDDSAWLIDDQGHVVVLALPALADKNRKDRIEGMTVLLAPISGGLAGGMLNGDSQSADDVADTSDRIRLWADDPDYETKTEKLRLIRRIDFAAPDGDDEDGKSWQWFEVANEGGRTSKKPVAWCVHVQDVVARTEILLASLPLAEDLKSAIRFAAKFHDHGKKRKQFQTILGNRHYPRLVWAKSGKRTGRVAETYRHEFGSLLDVQRDADFMKLPEEMKELVLHLIGAHHGRARPGFLGDEAFDPETSQQESDALSLSVPRRFARLQRRYGRWGLAYLESLLRAADWHASENPSAFVEEQT